MSDTAPITLHTDASDYGVGGYLFQIVDGIDQPVAFISPNFVGRWFKKKSQVLQLKFQCDADLGGNQDNGHSQTSYIGYLGEAVICWCYTDQGSVSTSTAESEIKAVNHTLKAEVISNRGIMNAIGWIQKPTIIQEDNQACVYASEAKHMTRNLRHLELAQLWFKEKVADGV